MGTSLGTSCDALNLRLLKYDIEIDFDVIDCKAMQATYGVYCGCINPIASNGTCRICGGSGVPPNPNCTEHEYDGILNSSATCSDLQEEYYDECCEALPTNPPTMAPTSECLPFLVSLEPQADVNAISWNLTANDTLINDTFTGETFEEICFAAETCIKFTINETPQKGTPLATYSLIFGEHTIASGIFLGWSIFVQSGNCP